MNIHVEKKRVTVTLRQLELLRLLSRRDQLSIGEVASLLGISSVGATKNVARLERKQLVERVTDEWDRRRVLISLTDAGWSTLREPSK